MLCFLEADWPLFNAPEEFRGVRIESDRSLKRLVMSTVVLEETPITDIASALATTLPISIGAWSGSASTRAHTANARDALALP
jgi:hypothetical protein